MNCKPNDLAVVIKPYVLSKDATVWVMSEGYVGKIVRVLNLHFKQSNAWAIETPFIANISTNGSSVKLQVLGIPDDHLRRLPGISEDEHIEQPVGEVA